MLKRINTIWGIKTEMLVEQHLKTQPYNITLKDPLKTSSLSQVGSFIATFYSEFRINLEKYLTYCSDTILWEKIL